MYLMFNILNDISFSINKKYNVLEEIKNSIIIQLFLKMLYCLIQELVVKFINMQSHHQVNNGKQYQNKILKLNAMVRHILAMAQTHGEIHY